MSSVRGIVAWSVLLSCLAGGTALASGEAPFARESLAAHVHFLSSPDLAGREAGTEGECRAAEYIAKEFAEIGLSPIPPGSRTNPFCGAGESSEDGFIHVFMVYGQDTVRIWGCPEGRQKGKPNPYSPSGSMSNVIGAVDPDRPGKALVIGAHFDHLGRRDGAVYPGADDNASGVAVLLEIARAYAAENPWDGPVIFAAFTGEEKGTLGSRAYVCDPPFPLEKTAAMVNIDMVGRLGDQALLFATVGLADSTREAFRAAGAPDVALAEMRSGYEAGDLAPFAAAKVPSLLLFTGPHADYHRPSDTEDKIDYAGLEKVGRFAARAVPLFGRLAAGGFAGPSPSSSHPAASAGERPFLGTVPDFQAPPGEGVLVAEVVPGSPAEAAGIRAGDRVVELGGTSIADLKEYAAALRLWKPGDRVSVTIRRGAERIEAEAVLTKRVDEAGHPGGHPSGAPHRP